MLCPLVNPLHVAVPKILRPVQVLHVHLVEYVIAHEADAEVMRALVGSGVREHGPEDALGGGILLKAQHCGDGGGPHTFKHRVTYHTHVLTAKITSSA